MNIRPSAVLTASGTATLGDAEAMLDMMCEHFTGHGKVTKQKGYGRIESLTGTAELTIDSNGRLLIEVACPEPSALFNVKSILAEHLFHFAGDGPVQLDWDEPQPETIPFFQEASVVSARNVTPMMRRVTLKVANAAAFSEGGLHVRLLIPPAGRAPVWPTAHRDGRIRWPEGEDALVVRAYTIRALDPAADTVDIDFVLHVGGVTPAATWSCEARPGARIGLLGPGGGGLPDAPRLLIAGDETALPAIARMAERVPAGQEARVFIEVAGPEERQPIPTAAGIELVWLYRNGASAGSAGLIEAALRDALDGEDDGEVYIWVACGQTEAKAIRKFLRNDKRRDRSRCTVAAYWRNCNTGDGDERE